MDGLDNSFGLLPDAAGHSRVDAAWADYCAVIGVLPGAERDEAAVSRAVTEAVELPALLHTTVTTFTRLAEAFPIDDAARRLAPLVSAVFVTLPAAALQRIVAAMEVPDRKAFARSAVPVLSPTASLAFVRAAGAAFDAPLSPPLWQLLRKLREEADTLPGELRVRADQSFRSLVLHLVESWSASTISAASTSFESMFEQHEERRRTRVTPEPLRVIQLSLESGAIGNVVWGAVAEQTRGEEGMRELLDLIKKAPADSRAAGLITDHVATPARLTMLLAEDPIDMDAVDAFVGRMGVNAVRPLLDQLVEARHRGTRRELMDRLVKIGPDIGPFVRERIDDSRWYVVRNMISLLREAGCTLEDLPIERFRAHEDARVRRETLQLQLENPRTREAALGEALRDADRNVLRTALQAARTSLPESAVPVLAKRLADATFPPEFRVMSLYLLGRSGSVLALDTLLAFAQGGSSLFGKPKLAPKSPEMLAALGGLARSWPNERRASVLIELARKSKDDQILNALHAQPGAQ